METNLKRRPIEWWEQRKLESNGCRAADWNLVRISDATELEAVVNVEFRGAVSLGILRRSTGSCIRNAVLENVTVGDYATIGDIGVAVRNCTVGRGARICNTGLIDFEPEATCGVGVEADVLDETGSRAVTIYPGLSAQTALLMAREPKWSERHLRPLLEEMLEGMRMPHGVGDGAEVTGCGELVNVSVGKGVKIQGAGRLRNGSVVNNAPAGRGIAAIGYGVDAENFIVEDGVLDSGAIIRNCYIGQGCVIEKGFTAHDSVFSANCAFENGEAVALLAGPYTVSMHKSSLLIGCQTSFMNAGSGTNQSNHMYKLGPVHWGLLERGVKTSSDSYLMLGAKIGAFSLLMGQHKTHPDSSQFPFSYLFGDDRGATVVVPGVMLKSCGLMRDEQKWPSRDRRMKRRLPMRDRVVYDVLSPLTVGKMLSASEVIDDLLARPADDDRYLRYRGMKFTRASLERARNLYGLAVCKYLTLRGWGTGAFAEVEPQACEWVDIAGLPMRRNDLEQAMRSRSVGDLEQCFDRAMERYRDYERAWIMSVFAGRDLGGEGAVAYKAAEFDRMVEEDRTRYLEDLAAQNEMLAL